MNADSGQKIYPCSSVLITGITGYEVRGLVRRGAFLVAGECVPDIEGLYPCSSVFIRVHL